MKYLLAFLLLPLARPSDAQTIITTGLLSRVPGEHFRHTFCDTVPVSAPGPAQTWDMSQVTDCATPILYSWEAPGPTPPSPCTVALHYGTTSSMDLYNDTPGAFQLTAVAPFPNEIYNYMDPLDAVRYPMAYGDSFFDVFSGLHTPPQGQAFNGSHTLTYDAYGTLIMPFGTIENVFRLHSRDTLLVPAESFRSKITDTYDLYSPAMHDPWVRIIHTYALDGTYQSGGTLLFVPDPAGVEELTSGTSLALFPDPASTLATVRTNMRPSSIQAIDPSGRTYAVPFTRGDGAVHVDLSALAPGIHQLMLRAGDEVRTVRFVKE